MGCCTPSGGRDVQVVSWGEPAGRETVSGAGRDEEDGPPAGGDSHPERHSATDREGDKVQSGKPRGEQGERERDRDGRGTERAQNVRHRQGERD